MTKFEIKTIDFIQKHILIIGVVILTLISFKIRWSCFGYKSGDYNEYLLPWYHTVQRLGGVSALKFDIGNYSTPYMFILSILTYFQKSPLILIKIVSVFFDYTCALVCYSIVNHLLINSKFKNELSALIYIIIIFLPTVILNSAYWGQCDSIYICFLLLCILMLIKDKYSLAFIFFGIAFAFKLQAIFILPLLIILYFVNRKFSILNFLIIPVTFVVMVLPTLLVGGTLKAILEVYTKQIDQYKKLTLNYPNLYTFIKGDYEYFKSFGIWLTIGLLGIITIIIIYNKWEVCNDNIISIALLTSYVCIYFLPSMHDRYGYILDILSVVYAITKWHRSYIPVVISFISLASYMTFLINQYVFNWQIISLANGITLIVIFMFTMDDLKISNTKINKNIVDITIYKSNAQTS